MSVGRSIGITSLAASQPLPASLPGAGKGSAVTTEANSDEANTAETVAEGGSEESVASSPEAETVPVNPSPAESSQPAGSTIVDSEG